MASPAPEDYQELPSRSILFGFSPAVNVEEDRWTPITAVTIVTIGTLPTDNYTVAVPGREAPLPLPSGFRPLSRIRPRWRRRAVEELCPHYFDTGLAAVQIHPREMYPLDGMICELGSADGLASTGAVAEGAAAI